VSASLRVCAYRRCMNARIHFTIRLEDDRLCALVLIGVRPDGTKEVIALEDGYRESAANWRAVLRDLSHCLRNRIATPPLNGSISGSATGARLGGVEGRGFPSTGSGAYFARAHGDAADLIAPARHRPPGGARLDAQLG